MMAISLRRQTVSKTIDTGCFIFVLDLGDTCAAVLSAYKAKYKLSRWATDSPSDGYLATNLTVTCLQLAITTLISHLAKFFAVTFMEHLNNFLYRA